MSLAPKYYNRLVTREEYGDTRALIKELKQDTERILTAVDLLAKKYDKFHAEMAANIAAHDRFEESITDIKKRLTLLEKKIL